MKPVGCEKTDFAVPGFQVGSVFLASVGHPRSAKECEEFSHRSWIMNRRR